MPRYFFHVYNDEITHDDEGADLTDESAAVECARRAILDLAAESIRTRAHLILHHKILVCGPEGNEVATVTSGEAIDVRQ